MAQLASFDLHTDAVLAALKDADLVVGDGDEPTEPFGWQGVEGSSTFIPYVVLYDFPGSSFTGPYGCPNDDATLLWQTVCVGATRSQAAWMADATKAALLGLRLSIPGRKVDPMSTSDAAGGMRRDDSIEPNLFALTLYLRAFTSPSNT